MIDASHGGYDVGSISNFDDYEKDINLDIALLVGKQLKSYGFNVVYFHTIAHILKLFCFKKIFI